MKRTSIAALLSAAVFSLALPSESAGEEERRPEHCKQEIAEACPGLRLGDGKLGPCVQEHGRSFSKDCRGIVKRFMPKICYDDARSICPGLKSAEFAECVKSNFQSLSMDCRDQLKTWYLVSENWKSKAQEACVRDVDKCPGLSRGFSDWWTCLKRHKGELSLSCREFMRSDKED